MTNMWEFYIFTSVFLNLKKNLLAQPGPLNNGSYENFNENSFQLNLQNNINKGHPMLKIFTHKLPYFIKTIFTNTSQVPNPLIVKGFHEHEFGGFYDHY